MSNMDQETIMAISAINAYVGGVIFILGTFGNLMNIIAFSCLKTYRPLITSTFLAVASFAGQLYLTFSLGLTSISEWINIDISSRNLIICKFTQYIQNVSVQISSTCLCLSSIDRYLMTSRSARQRQFMTQKRARLLIGLSILIWMCAEIPYLVFSHNNLALNSCIPGLDFVTTATYLNLSFSICLPIAILSVFGLLTWKNLGNTRVTNLNSQVFALDINILSL